MHQEFPRLMYGPGSATRLVYDEVEQGHAEAASYATSPGEAHRVAHRTAGPVAPATDLPLTEAHIPIIVEHVARALGATASEGATAELLTAEHIPTIVDAVFDRLKGMALAAASDPAHRAAAEGVDALRGELDERFAAFAAEIRALIAPAPTPAPAGKTKA